MKIINNAKRIWQKEGDAFLPTNAVTTVKYEAGSKRFCPIVLAQVGSED